MRIVGFGIDKVLPDGHATVDVARGIIQQSRTYGTTVVPQRPSSACIEREHVIGGSHVHHAAYDDRSGFQPLGIAGVKNPSRSKLGDVCSNLFRLDC